MLNAKFLSCPGVQPQLAKNKENAASNIMGIESYGS